MSDANGNTTVDNYKGMLQQYCHMRNLDNPSYVVARCGPANEPSWRVEVNYGPFSYATSDPLQGTKRLAEQMAAKQVLESIKQRQEDFLAGKSLPNDAIGLENSSDVTGAIELQSRIRTPCPRVSDSIPVEAPIELITSALSVASERLTRASQRISGFHESCDSKEDNRVFAQNLAELTMRIVREIVKTAKSTDVKFLPSKSSVTSEKV